MSQVMGHHCIDPIKCKSLRTGALLASGKVGMGAEKRYQELHPPVKKERT